MALEDRVKQLEDELKVLKNEIQTTLLDIQEQVLSHYYPSLYPSLNTEVSSRPKAPVTPPPQEQPYQIVTPSNSGIHSKYKTKTITLVEDLEEDDKGYDQDPDELIDPSPRPEAPSLELKKATKSPAPNGNGRSPKQPDKKPNAPYLDSSAKNVAFLEKKLIEENNKFLDSLNQAVPDEEQEETVLFDELGEILQKNKKKSDHYTEPITGEMLDELFNETFPFLADNKNGRPQSDSNSLNSQAVKITVRKLLSWIDESVAIIGKTRTKQAVEMYVRAGDLPPKMHDTLLVLVDSSRQKPAIEQANIKQIINTLGKLNDILDHHTPQYLIEVMNFVKEVNFG